MSATRVLALLLVWSAPALAHAEDLPPLDRLALEGRWAEARTALSIWARETPQPLNRLDTRGGHILLWRGAWTLEPAGSLAPVPEDPSWQSIGASGRVRVRDGKPPTGLYPEAFPALHALWQERLQREELGMGGLPTGSPLAALPDPDGTVARFLAWQAEVYKPTPAEQSHDSAWAAKARTSREQAESLRSSAHIWAALAAGLLALLTLVVGLRFKPPERDA